MLIVAAFAMLCAGRCPGQSQPSAPAATAEGGGERPSGDAVARLRAMKEAVVLVAVRFNGNIYASPGVVFHRNGDQAFVAARRFAALQAAYSRSTSIVSGPEFFVLRGQGSQRQAIRCQRVSAFERGSYCVVSGPADRLPPPIPSEAAPEPAPQMPVYVIGYENDQGIKPPAYADFAEKGMIRQVNRNREGQVTTIDIQCTETPTLSFAVVATTSGHVVGVCLGQRPRGSTDDSQFAANLPSSLTELLETQLSYITFGFESGDTKRVVYEFVAVVNDPCRRMSSPRLSILAQEYGQRVETHPRDFRPGSPPPPEPPPVETLPDAITLDVENRSPSDAFQIQQSWFGKFGDEHKWVALHPADNPGVKRKHLFRAQLSYVDAAGKKVYLPPKTLEFDVSRMKGDAVPAIPGIDGKPIDYPRPVQLADGTYRVTSECTRVDPVATAVKLEVPQPVQSGKVLASKVSGVGGRRAIALDVAPPQKLNTLSVPVIPAVFSPDGAWLYLVDASNVIRKIGTTDFTEQAYLEAGASCTSLGYSRAGLVAAVTGSNAVWVLDPDSLKVKRSIPAQAARMVTASPATGICFVESRIEAREPSGVSGVYSQLLMMDLEKGQSLHRLQSEYYARGTYNLRIGNTSFDYGFGTPHLTKDGKYLYLAGHSSNKRLRRFRVDGEDLIYERSFGLFPRFMGEGTLVSQKRGFRSYFVHELEESDEPKFEIDVDEAGPMAIDPKSGSIYLLGSAGNMYVFDTTGKKAANFVVTAGVSYLLPHPGGERLLGWGQDRILYYDLELGRLAKAVDSRHGDAPSADVTVASTPLTGELRPLMPGNLVTTMRTSSKSVMFELNSQGEVVQSIDVPMLPDAKFATGIHDLVVAPDGSLYVMVEYTMTTTRDDQACVALLGPDRKEWRFWTLPNEKKSSLAYVGDIELLENGKVAVLVNYAEAFLLDPREASGAFIPIPSGKCMTFGPDGTYYTSGGSSGRNTICTYDLETLRKTGEIKTDQEPSTMVVDQDGNLYLARSTRVTKIAPDGSKQQLNVHKTSHGESVYDMALSSNGKLALGSRSGKLYTVDRDLNEESPFEAEDEDLAAWVAWVPGE